MRKLSIFVGLLASALTAEAHDPRHHDPHVHGQANLAVALDGTELAIELESPGIGLLDFERPARSAAEHERLETVLNALRKPQWLRFPTAAQCRLRSAHVDAEGYGDPEQDSDEPGHHHAGFQAQYGFSCSRPERLDHLQVLLPHSFPGLHRVIVDVATASGQNRTEVDAGRPRVALPR